jgi:hypothetical protein
MHSILDAAGLCEAEGWRAETKRRVGVGGIVGSTRRVVGGLMTGSLGRGSGGNREEGSGEGKCRSSTELGKDWRSAVGEVRMCRE